MGNYLESKHRAKAAGMTCSRYRSPLRRLSCYIGRVIQKIKDSFIAVANFLKPPEDVDLSNLRYDVMVIKRVEHPIKKLWKKHFAEKKEEKQKVEQPEDVDISKVQEVMEKGSIR